MFEEKIFKCPKCSLGIGFYDNPAELNCVDCRGSGLVRGKVVSSLIGLNKKKEVLILKKRDFWILPGGKVEVGESLEECLKREIEEEVPGLVIDMRGYYREFFGKSPSCKYIFVNIFFAKIGGDFKVNKEISDFAWIKKEDLREFNLSDMTRKILNNFYE